MKAKGLRRAPVGDLLGAVDRLVKLAARQLDVHFLDADGNFLVHGAVAEHQNLDIIDAREEILDDSPSVGFQRKRGTAAVVEEDFSAGRQQFGFVNVLTGERRPLLRLKVLVHNQFLRSGWKNLQRFQEFDQPVLFVLRCHLKGLAACQSFAGVGQNRLP